MNRPKRNHNPGNLVWIADPSRRWDGMLGKDEDGFAIFAADAKGRPLYGARALLMELKVCRDRHGHHTIREIIEEWAPAKENDTAEYIQHLKEWTGYPVDVPLPWLVGDKEMPQVFWKLAKAISRKEGFEVDDGTLRSAMLLAGVVPPHDLLASRSVRNGVVGVAANGGVLATAATAVSGISATFDDDWVKLIFIFATVGIAISVWQIINRVQKRQELGG